jgi:transcriptional regulator with XRE-family HTH domain
MQENLPGNNSLSERVRRLRGAANLTLHQVADGIHYDKSYISRIENGSSLNPSKRFLEAVSAYFGISIAWLATGEGEMVSIAKLPPPRAGSSEEEMMERRQAADVIRIFARRLSARQIMQAIAEVEHSKTLDRESVEFWSPIITRALFNAGQHISVMERAVRDSSRTELAELSRPEIAAGDRAAIERLNKSGGKSKTPLKKKSPAKADKHKSGGRSEK